MAGLLPWNGPLLSNFDGPPQQALPKFSIQYLRNKSLLQPPNKCFAGPFRRFVDTSQT
jgi:hypothetical protein